MKSLARPSLNQDFPLLQPYPLVFPSTPSESHSALEQAGHTCEDPFCQDFALRGRFCGGCLAEAAKDCARQIEAGLIAHGAVPGSDELRAAMAGAGGARRLIWFQDASILGRLSYAEAYEVRDLTDAACLLVALGGVRALNVLPGTRDLAPVLAMPEPREEDSAATLRGRTRTGLRRRFSRETRFQLGTMAVLLVLLFVLVIW